MESFVLWLFDNFGGLLNYMAEKTTAIFFDNLIIDKTIDFNLLLFSETPIIQLTLEEFIYLFFITLYSIVFIIIVYKLLKKIFKKLFFWGKW